MKFKEYTEAINEAMNPDRINPSKFLYSNGTYYAYEEIGDDVFLITFKKNDKTMNVDGKKITDWTYFVDFSIQSNSSIKNILDSVKSGKNPRFQLQHKNNGNEFRVFPKVMGYILAFLNYRIPNALILMVDKNESGRLKLYSKMMLKHEGTLQSIGYTTETAEKGKIFAYNTWHQNFNALLILASHLLRDTAEKE